MSKIPTEIYVNADAASKVVAKEIAEIIKTKNSAGKAAVLGLATGSTPKKVYAELVRLHKEEGLSFKNVVTFNLDEYYPMTQDHKESYWKFMREQLFNHIDIPKENYNLPHGDIPREKVAAECAAYEEKIAKLGGLDFQLLGIGGNGHIGFNEPGSAKDSKTRLVQLHSVTRNDAANDFGGLDNVPTEAITTGVATILGAKRIIMLAFGEKKATVIKQAIEGPVTDNCAASFLQGHNNTTIYLDEAAAKNLSSSVA